MVNFRLHPRDSVEAILAHVSQVVADPRVELKVLQGLPASRVSAKTATGFAQIGAAVQHSRPAGSAELILVSGLTIGGTDSRFYETAATDSYRFNPMVLTPAEVGGFHGNNERISQDNLVRSVQFYHSLLNQL